MPMRECDGALRDAPRTVFGQVDAPTDVFVYVYPLSPGGRR